MFRTPRAALARPETSLGKYCAKAAKLNTVVAPATATIEKSR
jgi:hypothetical protein